MPYDPARHHRRSIRLQGYDYSLPGAYFVTLVTRGRELLFGKIAAGEMIPSQFGRLVERAWLDLPRHYPQVTLDVFCLMPNHMHGIIVLVDSMGRGGSARAGQGYREHWIDAGDEAIMREVTRPLENELTRHGIPEIVRALKSYSSRRINHARNTPGKSVWQRNYYEHIVRNERELEAIRAYILGNPLNWEDDPEYTL